jgi:hypothetical protein
MGLEYVPPSHFLAEALGSQDKTDAVHKLQADSTALDVSSLPLKF